MSIYFRVLLQECNPGMLTACNIDDTAMLEGYKICVTWLLQGLQGLQGFVRSVPKVLQGCCRDVTDVLQCCCRGVAGVTQGCYGVLHDFFEDLTGM